MNIRIIISPYPALLENMVAKLYEAATPAAEIDSHTFTTPHNVSKTHTFTGLDKVTHIIKLYTQSGSLLCTYDAQATEDTVTIFDFFRFKIGDGGTYTPTVNTSIYSNSNMAGMMADDYVAFRAGYGPLIEGIHITNNLAGGFTLAQSGDVWSSTDEVTIMPKPKAVTTVVNDSVVGKQWGPTSLNANMYVDVSSAVSYEPAHLRKLIRLAGSNAEYTFGNSNVPPVGYPFRVTNFGAYTPGSASPKVKFSNAVLLWGNTTKIELEIPFSCTAEFVWDGTNWNCSMNFQAPPSSAPVANQIVYNGSHYLSDVSEGIYTIQHNQNLGYTYKVFGVLKSLSSNHAADNTVCWAVREFAANNFKLTLQEIFGDIQNLQFDYILVKA
jgi:hypothetical protein